MTTRKAVTVTVLIVVIGVITGVIALRNRQFHLPAPPTCSTNRVVSAVKVTEKRKVALTKPLYGMASLSNEEREILRRSFQNAYVVTPDFEFPRLDGLKASHDAYRMGIICLKHRLNRSEVLQLITAKRLVKPALKAVYYYIGPDCLFMIDFTKEGGIKSVLMDHAWYKFPALEDVTPDTSIEPPPIPYNW